MAIREIRTFDDECLRKKCRPVQQVDDHIRQLLDDMAQTMYAADHGAGLAANQVGVLRRLVVIDMGQGLMKLVNPEIIEREGERESVEGCLSFPGQWGLVKRPKRVKVRALSENGEPIEVEGEDDLAKCLCHEIDHLDGEIFLDKVTKFVTVSE